MVEALRSRPRSACLFFLLTVIVSASFAVFHLSIKGDVARALKGDSAAYRANTELENRFGAPSKDEILFVTAGDLGDAETFAAFEDLVLSLQLSPGVAGVISIFSLPDPSGLGLNYLSREGIGDAAPSERLDRLLQAAPLAPYLLSEDRNATLVTVIPDRSVPLEDRLAALEAEIAAADPALTVKPVGLAALQREISSALMADQAFIAPASTLLCVLFALFLFRSWRTAILCAVPSVLGLSWTVGAMALLGIPFDPFMAIIPTLIIVLGIADSVHVFYAVMRHRDRCDIGRALVLGLNETIPAVILAALTTALAFVCLSLVGSPTLSNVALVGPIGMAMTTLAVYLALPPAALLLLGDRAEGRPDPLRFRGLAGLAIRVLPANRIITFIAFASLALLLAAQTQTVIGFRLMEHVPKGGEFRETLERLKASLPGSDQAFVVLEAADPRPGLSPEDRALLARAGRALYGTGDGFVPPRDMRESDAAALRRFEAADGGAFALPVVGSLDRSWQEILGAAEAVSEDLKDAGLENAQVVGYSLMASVELPRVVQELRVAFYVAVGLVALLAALLTRSVRIAALSMVPNLLPILGVEAWLFLTDRPLTIIGGIAFTVAFGIAVDDTIHLLNRLRLARPRGAPVDRAAIETALRAASAPILTTSLILLAGFATTAFSLLPSVSVFGQLTAVAMLLAAIADLFLFPSLLCWGAIGARTR
ncbi:MMPL family transporter [Psychromarinibacter sp. C21-152]|uniref:MMPL family transporter n=1 Tax=Psychromarinibacter sediminicola TaxID=3033385 RepID=A0AAE3NX56_9RHOB|nr:MMPL family transporter [Psychromarinibacter sediminicola]MDF0603716.1 MMPL family transporter [Psychromarinibacter sediminicola]